MGTPDTSSGSHTYSAIGAPDNNQQLASAHDPNRWHQQMQSLYVPPPYRCTCYASHGQEHLRQCLEFNYNTYHLFLQAQQQPQQPPPQPQPNEQPWPFGSGQSLAEQATQLRSLPHYEMTAIPRKSSSSNGGQIEEVEDLKQPATQAVPMEIEAGREANGGGAQLNSTAPELNFTAQHQGPPEQGLQHGAGVSNQDEHSAPPEAVHPCCGTLCLKHDGDPCSDPSPPSNEKKSGNVVMRLIKPWMGSNEEKGHNRSDTYSGGSRKDRDAEALSAKKLADLEDKMRRHSAESQTAIEMKTDELRRKEEELEQEKSKNAQLVAELRKYQNAVKSHESEVTILKTKVTEYKTIAEKMAAQLSSLEQLNSKAVSGTGAHRDTPAIPPNLMKSVFVVNEVALTCTKHFITFFKGRKLLQNHEALQNLPVGADERYRKYAVEAYLCSRLFAGFENDSYLDSLDCVQVSERYLPPNYKQTEFFLQNQDVEKRRQRYLEEYESLQSLGLQKVMEVMKNTKAQSINAFHLFCCRKLVNVMSSLDAWFEEFGLLENIDYSKESILYHLASNPKYCEKFLKPVVNLAMVTFLLHRLAFQFQPPARIFRYVVGARFDPTYMENAVPIDDDSVEELVVGLMLVPGFQVGATIVKCTVYLVPSSTVITQTEKRKK